MRARLLLLAVVVGLTAAPGASAAPAAPELTHGPFAGQTPPAPVFDPLKSFKIELLGL